MNYEKKLNSKVYIFFEWLYRLLIVNVMMLILLIPIITFFPAVIAAHATLKDGLNGENVFKTYFRNFKHFFKKAFLIGVILLIMIGVISYSFYFYSYAVDQWEKTGILAQLGIVVMLLMGLVLLLFSVHIPLLLITFEKLTIFEIMKTSVYICFRYFITTLILLLMFILEIIGVIALPIWMLFGISLPMLLGMKMTRPIYMTFEKIDLEGIMHAVEEEDDEE